MPTYKTPKCGICRRAVREYYMIRNDLWERYGCGERQAHIRCVEIRMKRDLELGDLTAAPINSTLRAAMGAPELDDLPSVKALRWNLAERRNHGHVDAPFGLTLSLAVGTEVVARKAYDPHGANVREGQPGFVFGETDCYNDGAGPIVKWISGGVCNIYPHMSEAVWAPDSAVLHAKRMAADYGTEEMSDV